MSDGAAQDHVLVTVLYDSGMEERLLAELEALGLQGWSHFRGGHGRGGAGRKEDTPVWPGAVNLLYVAVTAHQVDPIVAAIRALQRTYTLNPGVTIWTNPISLH